MALHLGSVLRKVQSLCWKTNTSGWKEEITGRKEIIHGIIQLCDICLTWQWLQGHDMLTNKSPCVLFCWLVFTTRGIPDHLHILIITRSLMECDGCSPDKASVHNSVNLFHINVLKKLLGSPLLQITDRKQIGLGFFELFWGTICYNPEASPWIWTYELSMES